MGKIDRWPLDFWIVIDPAPLPQGEISASMIS